MEVSGYEEKKGGVQVCVEEWRGENQGSTRYVYKDRHRQCPPYRMVLQCTRPWLTCSMAIM